MCAVLKTANIIFFVPYVESTFSKLFLILEKERKIVTVVESLRVNEMRIFEQTKHIVDVKRRFLDCKTYFGILKRREMRMRMRNVVLYVQLVIGLLLSQTLRNTFRFRIKTSLFV